MRIHHLAVSAFGPFPGRQAIDFEELNDAGLFLVSGPTGAGKTSILDAICFALFGVVPGGRAVRTLKSDHAAPEARPEVTLDFSLGGRRFEVRRTPEWDRPKRRGPGVTREKAAAVLIETTTGVEHLLSSRAQEVGHFLSSLLGMTAGQFQQVAMLPQGEFQTFLRASSQDRHDVLQQLFRTDRFTKIEDWVHDHSRRLRDEAADDEALVRRLVDNIAERAGRDCPAELCGERLASSASAGRVLPWADALVEAARLSLSQLTAEQRRCAEAVRAARDRHASGLRTTELSHRRTTAQDAIRALDEEGLSGELACALDADRRAARCIPVLQLLDAATGRLAGRRAAHEAAVRGLSPGFRATSQDDSRALRAAAKAVSARLVRLEALLPREAELRDARAELRETTAEQPPLVARLAAEADALGTLPERRAGLEKRALVLSETARDGGSVQRELAAATARADSAAKVAEAGEGLETLRLRARDARDTAADARERMLDVIARRLAGMAGELAGSLAEGEPCRVCGSSEHPFPAVPREDAVDEAEQAAATAEAEAARRLHDAEVERVQQAELRLVALVREAGGQSPDQAAAEVARLTEDLGRCVAAESELEGVHAEMAATDAEAQRLTVLVKSLEEQAARLANQSAALQATVTRLERQLHEELADESESVSDAVAVLGSAAQSLEGLADAALALERAVAEAARLEEAATETAVSSGFTHLDGVRGAALDDATRARLGARYARLEAERREAEAVLADPAVAALGEAAPDVTALKARLDEATEAEERAAGWFHVQQDVVNALETMRARLDLALDAWAPARERHLTADSMSRLVRGTGSDNQLQLRLSAYVLATRLDQVVDAANERLSQMREQRYLLERTGEAARRGSQAGLGLRVLDEWTGEPRDPATLSGGETFVVSLALALGLSDVVSTEAGGVQLGTLFIDEGFGMLDLDTLDDVMDRLDGLRAGGRTVGVVSHVTELRNRIPTQLHVDKHRHGSSVSVTTLIA